jgi:hypothetical protein
MAPSPIINEEHVFGKARLLGEGFALSKPAVHEYLFSRRRAAGWRHQMSHVRAGVPFSVSRQIVVSGRPTGERFLRQTGSPAAAARPSAHAGAESLEHAGQSAAGSAANASSGAR